nr:2-oxoglutarate and iron-dependent oxygenase domain-containing protein 3 isoform X7 [Oryctolagus cuniculus]
MAPQRRGAPRAPDGSTAAERRRPSSTKKDRALREVPGACLRTAGLGAGLALAALLLWSSLGTDDGVTEVLARRGELVAGRFVEVPCSEDYDGHRRFEECSVLLDVFSVSQSQPSTDGWVFRGGIRLFIGGNASGPNQGKTASASTEELPGGAALDRIPREDEPTSVAWALCPHRLFPGPPAFKTVFGCTPRKCGRGVSDVVITREEAQRIRSIAEKGLSLGGSHGGESEDGVWPGSGEHTAPVLRPRPPPSLTALLPGFPGVHPGPALRGPVGREALCEPVQILWG